MTYSPSFFNAQSNGSSRATVTNFQNGSGSTIALGVPVSTNTGGQILLTDVSSEPSALAFVGLTTIAIPNAANGSVINSGRLENITTSFAIGDSVYIGSTPGTLTNIKPNAGIDGFAALDFVILVGVVVKNEFNPSNKDIQLLTQIIGQLA